MPTPVRPSPVGELDRQPNRTQNANRQPTRSGSTSATRPVHTSMSEHRDTVGMDLFCGAGGMTLGAQAAGIRVIYAVERCPIAASTYHLNFPTVPLYVGDIRGLATVPKPPPHHRKIVFGGPPCRGFSTSNQRTRASDNLDNWLFRDLIRIAQLWEPDWIVIENVRGIKETLHGYFVDQITQELTNLQYTTSTRTLNAVHYSVPQRRERTFVFGSRHGHQFVTPPPLSSAPITVEDAISDLPQLSSGASVNELPYAQEPTSDYAQTLRRRLLTVTGNLVTNNAPHILRRYPYVPQGGNWANIPRHLMRNYADVSKCHTGIYRRLHPDRPSTVIGNFRKNMLIHPHQDRGLSIREAARIQSLPDTFLFNGSIGFQQQQVGNMVPPSLAKSVLAQLLER